MEFLVFQHVPHEHSGLFAEAAKKYGINLTTLLMGRWPSKVPDIRDYQGLIIMGGPMGLYDPNKEFPTKYLEKRIINQAIESHIPILGNCLGAQELAYARRASVYKNLINGIWRKEIGFYDISLTPDGQASSLFAGFSSPIKVLQWHGDTFDLPEGATLLASSPECENQAFRVGKNAYGLQFHFEFTPDMVRKQIEVDKKWIHEGFSLDEDKLLEEARELSGVMRKQAFQLFGNFVQIAGGVKL